jgi:hypothetical protein
MRTIFTGPPAGPYPYHGVTIGADGDVWLSTPGGSEGATFSRFDAFGTYKGEVPVGVRTFWLTTAHNGELFFMAQDSGAVYRLANNTTPVRLIIPSSWTTGYGNPGVGLGGVLLDQDGWLYLYQPRQGKLLLFNAQYQLARDPLAQVLDSIGWKEEHINAATPAWMRDATGAMTSRLLVTRGPGPSNDTPGPREILEVNHRGMGAPGADPVLRVVGGPLRSGALTGTPTRQGRLDFVVRAANGTRAGFARLSIVITDAPPAQVSAQDIADALMGGTPLPAGAAAQLDDLGNRNGRLDLGDLRAFLRAHGQLTPRRAP